MNKGTAKKKTPGAHLKLFRPLLASYLKPAKSLALWGTAASETEILNEPQWLEEEY